MIVKSHGCSRKGLMHCLMRTYLFTWKMGSQLGPPRTCVGKLLEGGFQYVPGLVFSTPPERYNLHHRLWGHDMVLLSILKEVCMGWCLKINGIRIGD